MINRVREYFNKERNYAKTKISGDGDNTIFQNVVLNVDLSKQEIIELVAKGENKAAAERLKVLIDCIPAQHPLFPDWRYELTVVNGNPVFNHVPNSPDATIKHPSHGTMRFTLPEEYRAFKNIDALLKHSYNKQIDIKVDILEFKSWIGRLQIDEFNKEDAVTAIISPRKFPAPVAMRLYFPNDSFSIDYLEMGLVEIIEPFFVLSNKNQENAEIIFELKIDIENPKGCKFKIVINDGYRKDVKANRIFNEFFATVRQNKPLRLKLLKEGKDIFSAFEYNFDNPIPDSIMNIVSILKKLEQIEEFYHVRFIVGYEGIPKDDLDKIETLSLAMKNEPRKGKYHNISLNIDVNENLSKNLKDIGSKNGKSLSFVTKDKKIELLGQTIKFDEYIVEFFNPEIKDKERTFKKLELMDVGEVIKIEFIPSQKTNKKKALCLEHYKINIPQEDKL